MDAARGAPAKSVRAWGYLLLASFMVFMVGCGINPTKESAESNRLPDSLESAVDTIILELSEEEKVIVKETSFKDLIRYHHGWGTGIRNSFGLWAGNRELLKSACGSEQCHADDASMEIIYGVWNVLNDRAYRYKPRQEVP